MNALALTPTSYSPCKKVSEMMSDKYLNRLSISAYDLEDSNRFLKQLGVAGIDPTQKEALLISSIICHARPFTGNEKNEVDALSRIHIEDFDEITRDFLTLHKKVMSVRNKAIAHAEWTRYPTRINPTSGIISSRRYSILGESFDTKLLIALNDKLILQLQYKRADMSYNRKWCLTD